MGFWTNKLEQEMKEERSVYEEAYRRVEPFYGKTPQRIVQELPSSCPSKDKSLILKQLGRIVFGQFSQDEKIQKKNPAEKPVYDMTEVVETFFDYRGSKGSQCNPGLRKADAWFYSGANKFRKLEEERGAILEGFGVANIKNYPFLDSLKAIPMAYIDTLKSAAVYHQLSGILQREYHDIFQDRKLTALYPASGGKLSPLLIATRAMDNDLIDSAEFTYTEINHQFIPRLHAQFQAVQEWGRQQGRIIIQNYRYKIDEFPLSEGGGVEVKFSFLYLTKKEEWKNIDLIFALRRSGEKYYRDEYIEKAELVIFDDSVNFYSSGEFVMKNKRPQGKQLVLLENTGSVIIGPKYKPKIIQGQYGHCSHKYPISSHDGAESAYVEYSQCMWNSALLLQLPR